MFSSKYSFWYISLLWINAISLINFKVKTERQIICEGLELEAFIPDVLWEPWHHKNHRKRTWNMSVSWEADRSPTWRYFLLVRPVNIAQLWMRSLDEACIWIKVKLFLDIGTWQWAGECHIHKPGIHPICWLVIYEFRALFIKFQNSDNQLDWGNEKSIPYNCCSFTKTCKQSHCLNQAHIFWTCKAKVILQGKV